MCCRKKAARRAAKQAALVDAMSTMQKRVDDRHYPVVAAAQPQLPRQVSRSEPPTYEEVMDDVTPYGSGKTKDRRSERRRDSKMEASPERSTSSRSSPHQHNYSHGYSQGGAMPYVPWYAYNNRPIARGCRAFHRSRCESSVCWCHADVSRLRV